MQGDVHLSCPLLNAGQTRSSYFWRGKVAGPSLGGRQVAVLRLHAASAVRVTNAAYSWVRKRYVLKSTMCLIAQRKHPKLRERRTAEVQLQRTLRLRSSQKIPGL